MPKTLSAVDSIGPAFEWTKRQLFAPFRFQRWARLAVVCMLTGEFAGGGGSPGGFHYQVPHSRRASAGLSFLSPNWRVLHDFLPWILAGILLVFGLVLLWLYVASVYRFVLFDSVLHNRCELKGAWRRWEPYGRSYFYWCLSLFFAVWGGLVAAIGVPAFLAWRAGWFHHPSEHLLQLVVGGVMLALLLFGFLLASGVAGLLGKDFCVPVMVLENLGVLNAWRRLLPLLAREKLAYAGFVLMKIVLAVGSAIIFGIATLVALVAVAIPLVVIGAVVYLVAKSAGLAWNPATLSLAVVLGGFIALGLLYLVALVSTPAMVFFQAYALHFFGGRYPQLGAILSPPEPPPTATLAGPPAFAPPPAAAPAA